MALDCFAGKCILFAWISDVNQVGEVKFKSRCKSTCLFSGFTPGGFEIDLVGIWNGNGESFLV